ncbi:MAG: glycosyltransferase family 4 protein [Anaerolineae bacterium]|nr:glycosyltransferase family 4 protein [Anaerolineae bacterium]
MRIALFHNLPAGGAKRHTYEQVRELCRRGYQIDEFTQSTADLDFVPFAPYAARTQIYDLPWKRLQPVIIPGIGPYIHWWQNYRNLFVLDRQSQRIAAEINAGGYDLAFVKDCMFVVAPIVLRYLRIPSVFYMHSVPERSNADSSKGHTSFVRKVINWPTGAHARMVDRLVVENLHCATRILTNSYFTREIRLLRDGIDSHVVYPGVDVDTFQLYPDANASYVLSAGSLTPAKGHWLVIEALGRLDPAIRPRLVIATPWVDSERRMQLEQYAMQYGVMLEMTSARDSQQMAQLYSNALFLAFAPTMELLGLVALEAMACGVPVVGVCEGGLRETVQNDVTGFLVERDPVQFAATMQRLIEDASLRQQLGQQARRHIESYWTWPRAVDDLEAQFAAALGQAKDR